MGILQQVQGSFGYPFYQEEVEELSSLEVTTVIVMAAKMLVCRDLAPNMA
jgi:tartrate dehydratase beta subunit/fumarate hydratase class I family protein